MRNLQYTTSFKKDIKRFSHDVRTLQILSEAASLLRQEVPLLSNFKDHALIGKFEGYRECHLRSDILLVYQLPVNTVIFHRLSSHSDIFKK